MWDETPIHLNLWVLLPLYIWKDLFKIGYKDRKNNKEKKKLTGSLPPVESHK